MSATRVYRARSHGSAGVGVDADPITTEVVRHGLNSAAEQMKRALIRTSFSPVIYEILDFAAALYDRHGRMLAQAPSNPLFMGTLDFCIAGATDAIGGTDAWCAGDIVLINVPYLTGSHQQDAGVVAPVFVEDELIGYAAIKAHWQDMGAKEPYCTDTVDVFQEGMIFPGVKLYDAGVRVEAIHQIVLANTRMPEMVGGDIDAEVVGVRTGVSALEVLVRRFGSEVFWRSVERMFDHGEQTVRGRIASLPDGRYCARGRMDSNGVDEGAVEFEIAVEINGSDVMVDFTQVPPTSRGPINCPLPCTVALSRVAVAMLAGQHESPNDGHFRPLSVATRPDTIFDPSSPAPCYLNGWLAMQAIDVIHCALADAAPSFIPAGSGGCICGAVWWGDRVGQEPWSDSTGHPIGQGAHEGHDGSHSLMHLGEAGSRFASAEVFEARYPLVWKKVELAADSGGAGRWQGGLGIDAAVLALDDASVTCVVERTGFPAWGLQGGASGRPNEARLRLADGSSTLCSKATGLHVPRGATLEVMTGGGGGFGDPLARDAVAVLRDLADDYISPEFAQSHYPQAFTAPNATQLDAR